MSNIKFIGKEIEVKIDRPLGSKHPKYGYIYTVNYGFVPNTLSGDGEELDCYVLGIYEPLERFKGKCIAIIHRFNDNDDKLIIVPDNQNFTNDDIKVLTEFQERFFESEIIRAQNFLEFNKNIPELSVSNLISSLKFYTKIGFKIEYERQENKFAFISLGKIQFMLQEITNNDKWDVGELKYPFGNGINFQLEVDNLDEIYKSIENSEYKITFERQGDRLLGNKEFLVQDPDGYLLRFSEDLGEKNKKE